MTKPPFVVTAVGHPLAQNELRKQLAIQTEPAIKR